MCPRALLPSPLPCRMPPFGPWSPKDICTLFRSPPSTSLCQQSVVCLYVHVPPTLRSPLVPITTLPETVLVPHGTFGALLPPLYLIQTEPFLMLALCPRALLPCSLPSRMSPFSRSSPEDICTLRGHLLQFCVVSQSLLLSLFHSQHPSYPVITPPEAVLVPHSPLLAL